MTLALAGTIRNAGVIVAEVNLKLIWDVVSQIKVGAHGHAYVVDGQGRLIAHPDISLVLRNTDLSRLAQVQAARAHLAGKQTRAGAGSRRHPNPPRAHRLRADRAARLDHVRRAAGRGSLCAALSDARALRLDPARRFAARAGRRPLAGAPDGGADPGAAAWVRRASARAISASASRSRPATSSKASPISSTTWPASCRNPMPTWRRRSKSAPQQLAQSVRGAARARRSQPGGQLDARPRDRAQHHRHQGDAARRHRGGRDLRL